MRLPLKGSSYASKRINRAIGKIEQVYLERMTPMIKMYSVNAMLGDGTVTQANTFDPTIVRTFYQRMSKNLAERGWSLSDISMSDTDDLRRIFFQVSKEVGKYHLVGYFGLQYHALPYYRVDKRVIEIQKELSRLADEAPAVFKAMSSAADKALRIELEKKGYANLEFQELFAKMFEDEELAQHLDTKAASVERDFSRFEEIRKKKTSLFGELNDLLIETYQTSCVAIDHNRQMQGEEGVTTYFDLEIIRSKKTKTREAYIDPVSIPAEYADKLAGEIDSVAILIKETVLPS